MDTKNYGHCRVVLDVRDLIKHGKAEPLGTNGTAGYAIQSELNMGSLQKGLIYFAIPKPEEYIRCEIIVKITPKPESRTKRMSVEKIVSTEKRSGSMSKTISPSRRLSVEKIIKV